MKYLAVCLLLLTGCTESTKRKFKTFTSEYTGGLNRVCTVYSLNGDIIKIFKGSFDIQEGERKLQFDLDGKRKTIYNSPVICEEI